MYKYLREYIDNREFRLTLLQDRINVVNYEKLLQIQASEIILENKNQRIIITGENLAINKLLEQELLITGKINNIEVQNG